MVDLKPTKEMAEAARLALASAIDIDDNTRSVAQAIASQRDLTPKQVLGLSEFYKSENTERTALLLHGGDLGRDWSNATLRSMLDENMSLTEGADVVVFKEMYLADTPVEEDGEGLIWKQIIHEGVWKEGPNGKPIKVVAGRSADPMKAIGLQDIKDAFDDNAVQHVTIPLSHEDRPDENTGYIKKMEIKDVGGVATLVGGHQFTEPDIKDKVKRKTIANTSAGLRFHYKRKVDGKHYPVVMYHNALTPKPWLSRLAPFGINASEADENYSTAGLEFAEVLSVEDRTQLDSTTTTTTPTLSPMDPEIASTTPPAAATPPVPAAVTPPPAPALVAPPVVTPEPLKLSDHPDFKAQQEENARLKAQVDQLAAKDKTRGTADRISILKKIGFTEEAGCTEFLQKVREFFLADNGDATLLLTDESSGTSSRLTVTQVIDELIGSLPTDEKTGRLKVVLSEQISDPLATARDGKPSADDENDGPTMFSEDWEKNQDQLYAAMFPSQARREQQAAAVAAQSKAN